MVLWVPFGGGLVDRTMYEKQFLSISPIQQNSLVLFIGLAQISYITMYVSYENLLNRVRSKKTEVARTCTVVE